MPPQAPSVSLNMFIVLKEGRNEILRKDIESFREKYIAQIYFKANMYNKIVTAQ
jgi:hypothetical protein